MEPELREVVEQTVRVVQAKGMRRVAFWAGLAAFIAACAVAIPVSLVVQADNASTQRHNAERICEVQREAVAIQRDTFRATVEQNARNREIFDPADFGLTPKQWERLIEEGEAREEATLERLEALAAESCHALVE